MHNHPSRNPDPSIEDLNLTVRVQGIGDVIGMPLVDHIIVTGSGRFSSFVVDEWVKKTAAQE